MSTICNWMNPCSREFYAALDDFKHLSCTQKSGIILTTTLVACTILFAIAAVPTFRYLVGRCLVKPISEPQKAPPQPEEAIAKPVSPLSSGHATASQFVQCVNGVLPPTLTQLTETEAQIFLDRGGFLNTITDDMSRSPITICQDEQVVTGCTSGVNRSQVAAAIMIKKGIAVKGVLAGGDSAMNPETDFPILSDPLLATESAANFETVFGFPKSKQIGTQNLPPLLEDPESVQKAKEFYQNYIDQLQPTHFLTFSSSGASVLRRLLQRTDSLKGFTITFIPWDDEIAHPPKGLASHSKESYTHFASKLDTCFRVVP